MTKQPLQWTNKGIVDENGGGGGLQHPQPPVAITVNYFPLYYTIKLSPDEVGETSSEKVQEICILNKGKYLYLKGKEELNTNKTD